MSETAVELRDVTKVFPGGRGSAEVTAVANATAEIVATNQIMATANAEFRSTEALSLSDSDGDGLTNEAEYNSPLLSGYLPGRGSSHPCLGDTDGDLAVDALGGDGFPLDYHAWYDNDADALADQPVLASMSQPPIAEDAQFTLAISLVGTGQGTVLAAAETYTGTATTTSSSRMSPVR